mmetsp:Transcript_17340/g.37415  ORF Transcript_17340/g.37415 Transcript_17340/m.37415 type:complete len:294 (+) Transcript_17340:580-1461(+)
MFFLLKRMLTTVLRLVQCGNDQRCIYVISVILFAIRVVHEALIILPQLQPPTRSTAHIHCHLLLLEILPLNGGPTALRRQGWVGAKRPPPLAQLVIRVHQSLEHLHFPGQCGLVHPLRRSDPRGRGVAARVDATPRVQQVACVGRGHAVARRRWPLLGRREQRRGAAQVVKASSRESPLQRRGHLDMLIQRRLGQGFKHGRGRAGVCGGHAVRPCPAWGIGSSTMESRHLYLRQSNAHPPMQRRGAQTLGCRKVGRAWCVGAEEANGVVDGLLESKRLGSANGGGLGRGEGRR